MQKTNFNTGESSSAVSLTSGIQICCIYFFKGFFFSDSVTKFSKLYIFHDFNSIGPKIHGLTHFYVEVQGFEVIYRQFLRVFSIVLLFPKKLNCFIYVYIVSAISFFAKIHVVRPLLFVKEPF